MSHPSSQPAIIVAPPLDINNTNPIDQDATILTGEADEIIHYREYEPGKRYYGTNRYVEYICGNLPIIITVPHGGYAHPSHLPDRAGGCHVPDIGTQELARLLYEEFDRQLGANQRSTLSESGSSSQTLHYYPHMILNRLQRGPLDMNRNEIDASGGNPETRHAWRQFHAFVRRAKREVVRGRSVTNMEWRKKMATTTDSSTSSVSTSAVAASSVPHWSRCLYLDLHGQSHDRRHQLGYILNQQELYQHNDQQLDESIELINKSSLRCAVEPVRHESTSSSGAVSSPSPSSSPSLSSPHSRSSLSSILRGSTSFGAMLEARGQKCVPSPTSTNAGSPGSIMYFNGGYNTHVHSGAISGTRQREKERQAKKEEEETSSNQSSTSAVPVKSSTVVDEDEAFTHLFDTSLESDYFIGIQLESAYEGARDTPKNISLFASQLCASMVQFVCTHVLTEEDQLTTTTTASATTASN